jgi:hypothetical protein
VPTAQSLLGPWSNFYVITGSSAGALTGLMFVVVTLVAGLERSQRTGDGIGTFSTPTVVHMVVALVISAMLSAPWGSLGAVDLAIGAAAAFGLLYMLWVLLRTFRQRAYQPVLEDWLWYSIFPSIAYVVLGVCAIEFLMFPAATLFVVAAVIMLLILIGIHNSWDIVTYIATGQLEGPGLEKAGSGVRGPGGTNPGG